MAKSTLNDKRTINFLRAIVDDGKEILAVKLVNRDLDEGQTVKEIFTLEKSPFWDGMAGFSISAKKIEENKFKITFGCQVLPEAGDGGWWVVEFNDIDEVVSCEDAGMWVS